MFGRIAAFTSVALVSASCATKAVEKMFQFLLGNVKTAHLKNNMFFLNFKNTLESRIEMPWQRYWETLNRKASSIPTFAREGLEFLTLIAIGVGTDSFSGPLRTVIWG